MSNYYDGYYWGTNPYDSSELGDRITDIELKNKIVNRIAALNETTSGEIETNVKNAIVTLKGTVKTFQARRTISEEIWKIDGVHKVLNLLDVSDPMTAGPSHHKSQLS